MIDNLYVTTYLAYEGWMDPENVVGDTLSTYSYKVCDTTHFLKATGFDSWDDTGKTVTSVRAGADCEMESGTEQIKLYSYYADGSGTFVNRNVNTTRAWRWRDMAPPAGGWNKSEIEGITILFRPNTLSGNTLRLYRYTVEISWIPEPTSALLFLGALSLGFLGRRKRS